MWYIVDWNIVMQCMTVIIFLFSSKTTQENFTSISLPNFYAIIYFNFAFIWNSVVIITLIFLYSQHLFKFIIFTIFLLFILFLQLWYSFCIKSIQDFKKSSRTFYFYFLMSADGEFSVFVCLKISWGIFFLGME